MRRRGLLLALVVTLLGTTPARATPRWSAIETPGGYGVKPSIAFDAGGDALITWLGDQPGFGYRQLRYAWRPRGGPLGATGSISDYGATFRSIAVGWAGETTAAWLSDDGAIRAAVSPGPGKPFGSAQILSPAIDGMFSGAPKVVVDDVGDAAVTWLRSSSHGGPTTAVIALRTEGGPFAAPLDMGQAAFGGLPDIAVNGQGLFAAIWQTDQSTSQLALRRPGAPAFDAPEPVGIGGPNPQVAVGQDGTVVATGRPSNGGFPGAGPSTAVVRRPGAPTAAPVQVTTAGLPLVDGNGDVRVLASYYDVSAHHAVAFTQRLVDGADPVTERFDTPDVRDLTAGSTRDGHGVALWGSPASDGAQGAQPLRFAERSPGEPFGAPQTPPGGPTGAWPAAAISAIGSIGFAWGDEYTASPTHPVQMIVREDPNAVVPARPGRARVSPGRPAVSVTAVSARFASATSLRARVTCTAGCTVAAILRVDAKTIGTIAPRTLKRGTRTVTLRPSAALAAAVRRATHRGKSVRAIVTVHAADGGSSTAEILRP